MLIALLAVLGVDLSVIVGLLVVVLGRRRWARRRPGAFGGAVRVASGESAGFGSRWRRGYGRWVRDVLVWQKTPFLFRNELVPVDRLEAVRVARDGEVKRLGDKPAVIEVAADDAVVQIAAHGEHRDLALGPFRDRADENAASGVGAERDRPRSTESERRLATAARATARGCHEQGMSRDDSGLR